MNVETLKEHYPLTYDLMAETYTDTRKSHEKEWLVEEDYTSFFGLIKRKRLVPKVEWVTCGSSQEERINGVLEGLTSPCISVLECILSGDYTSRGLAIVEGGCSDTIDVTDTKDPTKILRLYGLFVGCYNHRMRNKKAEDKMRHFENLVGVDKE